MHLDTQTLSCFLAIVDTGSFSKAAEKINITQPALSQQISKLETRLKAKLFERSRKNQLTNSGEILLGYARQIIQIEREILQHFDEPAMVGEIRFGVPEDFASTILSDVLLKFAEEHPRIKLRVECDLTVNLLKRFKKNEFDLALVKMFDDEFIEDSIEVLQEKLVWVAEEKYINYNYSSNKNPLPLVLSPKPCVYRQRALLALDQQCTDYRIAYTSPSFAGNIAAVKAGMGLTVLPKNMIPEGLHAIYSKCLPDLQDLHVLLLTKKHSNAIDSFAQFVLHEMNK